VCGQQIPEEEGCPVVAEMLRLLATDSCCSVREAALTSICINKVTLPAIVARVRDTAKNVRKQARVKMLRVMSAGNNDEQDASLDASDSLDATMADVTIASDQ
jgi:hypothetical protein